jgi:predicted nucleic acid-binding protein
MSAEVYCLDTSALVNPWRRMWPPDLAPRYWEDVAALALSGRIVLSEEVREELFHKDDELAAWAKTNIRTWHPLTDEIQECVRDIMRNWGRLVDHRRNRGSADPFVIATAKSLGAIVVTDEGPGNEMNVRIPYVCSQIDVGCLGLLDFVRATGIRLA